jgi:hypothetical protein
MLGLHEHNTAEDRARALGYNLDEKLYHGTNSEFPAFERHPRYGAGTYATEDPEIADIYAESERREGNAAPNVLPIVARGKKLKVSDLNSDDPSSGGWFRENMAKATGMPKTRRMEEQLPRYGYDRLEINDMSDLGGIQTQHMFPDPSVIRSRFAAFDPHRVHENDLLAARGGLIHKADGGTMDTPTLAQMRVNLAQHRNPDLMDSIGVNEALDMEPKMFVNPNPKAIGGIPSIGGVATNKGMPIGGVDTNSQQPGQQLNPIPAPVPGQPQPGAPGATPGIPPAPGGAPTGPSGGAPAQMGNMLQMTPQGQALAAMAPPTPPATGAAPGMASGGAMRLELLKKKARDAFPHMGDGGQPPKRRVFNIMPATQGAVKTPNGFTPYDAGSPSIASLARAFDEAIAHHLALPAHHRMMNSVRAAEMVSNHVGRTSDNKPKDLLGKNAKLIKSEKGGEEAIKLPDGRGVETTGLALAPAFVQGKFNTCPNSASCKAECLGKTSGNYFKLGGGTNLEEFKGPRLNSLNKTLAMINDPHSFAVKLYDEIQDAKAIAAQNNNHLGVRLNVLSDLNPRVHKAIINGHPDVTFYDYTKNNTNPIAPNHHYTYSSTGVSDQDIHNPNSNWKQMRRRLEGGDNVAMAFTHNEHLPHQIVDHETGKVFKVINGDSHDFRPLDIQPEGEHGVIVGLKNKKAIGEKGNAHIDSNGFFVKYDPQLMKKEDGRYARVPTTEISAKTGKPKLGETIPQNRTVHIHPQEPAPREKSNDEGWEV